MTGTPDAAAIPGRCRFDPDGWLQGPVQITHVMTPNRYDSGFVAHARGLVFHTEDGFEAGTVETFMNPASQVSAFFSIAQSGACHQYLPVGKGYVAWAEAGGNPGHYSIEDEDRTDPAIPLTQAQIQAFAQILEACSARDGFPLQVTDDPVNGQGLILHSDGGIAWGDHPGCPGPVRAAQRPAIVALAREIRAGTPVPVPPQPKEGWTAVMIADLPTLSLGASDSSLPHWYVRRAQAILNVVFGASPALTADGNLGPLTQAAVQAVQGQHNLPVTGRIDPLTWELLLAGTGA